VEDRRYPLGVGPIFRPNGTTPDVPPYALFVGGIQPRKDPVTAIEALALVDGDLRLVLLGGEKRGGDEVRNAVRRLGLERRVELGGYIEHEGLATLYRARRVSFFRPATKASPARARGDGVRDSSSQRPRAPFPGWRARQRSSSSPGTRLHWPTECGGRSPTGSGSSPPVSPAPAYSWTQTARLTLDVYRGLL
jgi:Glycosyl transferases group 1